MTTEYYDCCICQAQHEKGDELYKAHMYRQSKHGVKVRSVPMSTDKQMHTQEVTTFEVVSVLGPYAGMESYSIAAFMGTEQEPYAFVAEKIKSKAVANLFASAPILQHQRDTLLESLKEMRDVCAALMRVVHWTGTHDVMENEFMDCKIKEGFGVRAQAAIQSAGGNHE